MSVTFPERKLSVVPGHIFASSPEELVNVAKLNLLLGGAQMNLADGNAKAYGTTADWAALDLSSYPNISGIDTTVGARVHVEGTGAAARLRYVDVVFDTWTAANTWGQAIAPKLIDNQLFETLGYRSKGDRGGNSYRWSAASTATADGGAIIAFSGVGTGRALGVFADRVLTPQRFGAYGNNSADDTAALLAMAAFANAAGENAYIVDLGPKSKIYRTTQTVTLSASNVEIRGREPRIKPIGSDFEVVVYTNAAPENTWAATTDYLKGRVLQNGANYYVVKVGGISGSTAPTHTSGDWTDAGVTYTYLDPATCTFVALAQGYHYSWILQPALWIFGQQIKIAGHVRTTCEAMTAEWGTGIVVGRDVPTSWSGNICERVSSSDAPWVDVAFIYPEQFTITRPSSQQVSGAGAYIGLLFVRPFHVGVEDARGLRALRHGIVIDGGTNVRLERAEGLESGSHQILLHRCDGVTLTNPDVEAVTKLREDKAAGVAIFQSDQIKIERPYLAAVQPAILYEDVRDLEISDPRMTDGTADNSTWTATTYLAGAYVFGPTAGNWYVLLTAGGGAAANEPVHGTGDVIGADSYEWRFVRSGAYFLEASASDLRSENIDYQANQGIYSNGVPLDDCYLLGLCSPSARTLESRQTYPQPRLIVRPQREILQIPFSYLDAGGYHSLRGNRSWQPFDLPKGARIVAAGVEVLEAFAAASGSFAVRLVIETQTSAYWALEAYLIYGGADIAQPGPLSLDDIYDRTLDGRYGMRMGFGASLGTYLRGHLASGEAFYPASYATGLSVVNSRYPAFAVTGMPYREGEWLYAELPSAAGGAGLYRVLEARPGRCTLDAVYTTAINKGFSGVADSGGNVECTGMSGHGYVAGDWVNADFASVYTDGVYEVLSVTASTVVLNLAYSATATGTLRPAVRIITAGRLAGATVIADATLSKSVANTLSSGSAGKGYIWVEYELTGLQRALT